MNAINFINKLKIPKNKRKGSKLNIIKALKERNDNEVIKLLKTEF